MKVVVAGNYGAGNLGDEMILEGVINMLHNVCEHPEITVLTNKPEHTKGHFRVHAEPKVPAGFRSLLTGLPRYFISTRRSIRNSDFFLLGGGGLFNDLSFSANYIWAMQALTALRFGKPLVMYGQSIGRLSNPLAKKLVKYLFSRASFISVRDKDSKERLEKLGIKKDIHVTPDMALRTELKELRSRKKNVIIALRALKKMPHGFQKEITGFIDWLTKNRRFKVKFIDFQLGIDRQLHDEIYDHLARHSRLEFLGHPRIPEPYFQEAEFVIGMRLHSIITAIKTHTPFLALNYAPKVEGLVKTIGFSDLLINLEDATKEHLIAKFEELEKKQPSIHSKLKKYTPKAIKEHQSTERELKRCLSSLSSK